MAEAGLEEIVEKVQRAFDKTRAMTARFEQTVETKGFGGVEKHSGSMAMLKPAMMRWDYDKPEGRKLVVDGERLWFYDPAENVVYFDTLEGYLNPRSPALFLAGEARLDSLFEIDLAPPGKAGKLETIRLRLAPKEPAPGLKAMLLTLDAGTLDVIELLMVDHLGNRNRIRLEGVDRAPDLEKDDFRFEPPEGTPVRAISKAMAR